MADDVTAPGAGETFATDQIGTRHFPKGKLAFGPDGTATDVTAESPLPVSMNGTVLVAVEGTVPVTVPAIALGTRDYIFDEGQRLTTTGTGQVRSAQIFSTEVLLHASVRGFYRVGDNTVVATVGAGSIPLEAGEKFHQRITSGQFISFVRDAAIDGSVTIMPVAE